MGFEVEADEGQHETHVTGGIGERDGAMVSRPRSERQLEVDAIHGDVHDGKPRAQPPEDTLHHHDQWLEKTDLPLQALRLLPVRLGHVNPEGLADETESLVVSPQTPGAQAIAEA